MVANANTNIVSLRNPLIKLCAICENLKLSPEKFVISSQPLDPASTAVPDRTFRLNTGQNPEPLPRVKDLKSNGESGCAFCKLIFESLFNVNDETICLLEWVIDGQQAQSAFADRYLNGSTSRRIRISWPVDAKGHDKDNPKWEELFFLCVPQQNSTHPNQDVKGLIRSWIQQCEEEHEECKHVEPQDKATFDRYVHQTSVGFIDVEEMKLAPLPKNSNAEVVKYAALSYVWGRQRPTHQTLYENIMDRIKLDGLRNIDLPSTILDAIEIVKMLGYRFLWIDSLCIVQDSPQALSAAVKKMNLIFGNAHLTICAADGDDPSGGLKAWRNMSIPREEKIGPGLQLLVSRPSESIIQASRWNERAWTFQERILSRRCLVFVGDRKIGNRVYFQCRSTNLGQDIYPIGTGLGWHSDWRKSPLHTLNELKQNPIRFYMNSVRLFTGRNLTEPSDILNAFDGVSRVMEAYMRAPFFFGLPGSHFDFALLWRPKTGKRRRGRRTESGEKQNGGDRQDFKSLSKNRGTDWQFPSWSWSGWEDMDNPTQGAAVQYHPDILEGCFIDLHEWLLKRTWIVWYIRDRHGDLHPIWKDPARYHNRARKSPIEKERRWQGYDYCSSTDDRDSYGRLIRNSIRGKPKDFKLTLPENPYGVDFSPPGSQDDSYRPILQFWTWRRDFYLKRNEGEQWKPGYRLARLQVADGFGHTCGTVVVDEGAADRLDGHVGTFIALSEAKRFTKAECPNWSYYIPKDLEDIEWDLFYVILIERHPVRHVWERLGLGKILKEAFKSDGKLEGWSEIQLG